MSRIDENKVARLETLLTPFRSLNPEVVSMVTPELYEFAETLGPAYFDAAAGFTGEVLELYLAGAVKQAEKRTLHDYYYFVDRAAKRLAAQGRVRPLPAATADGAALALVPDEYYNSLEWCTLNTQEDTPLDIVRAVDAAQRRNFLIDSALEPLFCLLLTLDRDRAFRWGMDLCSKADGPVDPDIARDLLRAWEEEDELPAEVLKRAMLWSEDPKTIRHWPAVTFEADRLLRRHSMEQYLQAHSVRTSQGARLEMLRPFRKTERLLVWLKRVIEQLGKSVDFFCDQSEVLAGKEGDGEDGEWRRDAIFRELIWLEQVLPPTFLLADLILSMPNGAFDFALAVFGFTAEPHRQWRERLLDQSRVAVRRLFLDDLKQSRSPVSTIHRLSFGNQDFEAQVMRELDYTTQQFDSLEQREAAVDMLAEMHGSRRQHEELENEITRRYRRLMRVLHEDNLRRLLSAEQCEELPRLSNVLVDLSAIAAESRKFLVMRRALEKTVEEIVAADMDYTLMIRGLRARYIHRFLRI